IYIKHKERERLETMANSMAARLRELLGTRVQGPEEPMVSRVQNLYIRRIMLKIENDASISKVKQLLADVRTEMTNNKQLTGAIVYQDVDPV
ncbi:MAG: primosomal protein N', partial [Duncaniella sp.]|nr:primosomal protein N' [Duncaniella sp.]